MQLVRLTDYSAVVVRVIRNRNFQSSKTTGKFLFIMRAELRKFCVYVEKSRSDLIEVLKSIRIRIFNNRSLMYTVCRICYCISICIRKK